MPIESGKRYVFINKQSGTALDLDTGSSTVQGWTRHGGPNQQWQVINNRGEGSLSNWFVKNVQQGTFLAYQLPAKDGKRIISSRDFFSWSFSEQGDNVYKISALGSQECVDLADHGNAADGTPVQLWTSWGGENQKWEAQEV